MPTLVVTLSILGAVFLSLFGNIDGYAWLAPIKIVSSVLRRAGFPTTAAIAWGLGSWANPQSPLRNWARGIQWSRSWALEQLKFATVGLAGAMVVAGISPFYHFVDLLCAFLFFSWFAQIKHTRAQIKSTCADALRIFVVFIGASFLFTIVKAYLFVASTPQDALIVELEKTLFGKPIHRLVVQWATNFSWSGALFDEVYFMLFQHMAVASIFLSARGLRRERAKLWSSICICYLLGGPAYYLLPALGPAYFEPETFSELSLKGTVTRNILEVLRNNTEAMRSGQEIGITPYSFIACMPSLHMAHELVMLWYSRFSRPFLALSFLFTILTSLAVMVLGWHYFVDILGGALLALLSVFLVERFGSGFPVSQPDKDDSLDRKDCSSGALGQLGKWVPSLAAVFLFASTSDFPYSFGDLARFSAPSSLQVHERFLSAWTSALNTVPMGLTGEIHFNPLSTSFDVASLTLLGRLPGAQHMVNVLLLAVCAGLISRLCRHAGLGRAGALAAGLLFVVHPTTTLTTSYVSARDWLLGGVLWLAFALRILERKDSFRVESFSFGLGGFLLTTTAPGLGLMGFAWFPFSRPGKAALDGSLLLSGIAMATGIRWIAGADLPMGPALGQVPGTVLAHLDALLASSSPTLVRTVTATGTLQGLLVLVFLLIGIVVTLGLTKKASPPDTLARAGVALLLITPLANLPQSEGISTISDASMLTGALGLVLVAARLVELVLARIRVSASQMLVRTAEVIPLALILALVPNCLANLSLFQSPSAVATELLHRRPRDPSSLALAGITTLVEKGPPRRAHRHCTAAARQGLDSPSVTWCRAVSLAGLGEIDQAHQLFRQLLPEQRESGAVRQGYIMTLASKGKHQEALEQAQAWLDVYPHDRRLRYTLGQLRAGRGAEKSGQIRQPTAAPRGHFMPSSPH